MSVLVVAANGGLALLYLVLLVTLGLVSLRKGQTRDCIDSQAAQPGADSMLWADRAERRFLATTTAVDAKRGLRLNRCVIALPR